MVKCLSALTSIFVDASSKVATNDLALPAHRRTLAAGGAGDASLLHSSAKGVGALTDPAARPRSRSAISARRWVFETIGSGRSLTG